MSRNSEESGRYIIPQAQWSRFKKTIIDAHNAAQVRSFKHAETIYAELIRRAKGVRGFDFAAALRNLGGASDRMSYSSYKSPLQVALEDEAAMGALEGSLAASGPKKRARPRKPMKKQFPLLAGNANYVGCGEYGVGFDNAKRAASWDVSRNNHAVERAHESVVGGAFFSALASTTWTRGSGGYIEYTDEYREEHDGSDFGRALIHPYGPLGKSEQHARTRAMMAYSGVRIRGLSLR